jgi:glutathione synthase/RimK-type ligase-like ATP-grasp enzyme
MTRRLNIGVISRIQSQTVNQELAREARLRGHDYDQVVFDVADLSNPEATFIKADVLKYDVLYYRTSLGPVWSLALQNYLARHNRRAINLKAIEFPFMHDKAQQALSVSSAGIEAPKTVLDTTKNYDSIASQLGPVFVAKARVSSQGKDVKLIRTKQEFEIFLGQSRKEYLYQEYIPHDYDCRVHLVGGQAVCGYRRVQRSDDFRCNVSLGADMEKLEVEEKATLFALANKVSALFGLELHAVDFLLSKKDGKYYFVEINDNPGWETSDTLATEADMSSLVIDLFEKIAEQKNSLGVFGPAYSSASFKTTRKY